MTNEFDQMILKRFNEFADQAATAGDYDIEAAMRRVIDSFNTCPQIKREQGSELMTRVIDARNGFDYDGQRLWDTNDIFLGRRGKPWNENANHGRRYDA